MGQHFGGAVIQGWHAYNITSDRQSGLGDWSDQQIAAYLSTGHAEGRGSASGSMAEAVSKSLQFLTKPDIMAIVSYLRTVKPIRNANENAVPVQAAATQTPQQAALLQKLSNNTSTGARLFAGACLGCHALDGSGLATTYAALNGSRAVIDPKATNATQVILQGTTLNTASAKVGMPAFGQLFSDEEIAALVNFTTGWFGRDANLTAAEVGKRRNLAEQ